MKFSGEQSNSVLFGNHKLGRDDQYKIQNFLIQKKSLCLK